MPHRLPTEPAHEYWADGVVHVLGVILAVTGSVWLSLKLSTTGSAIYLPFLFYIAGLIATFSFSAAYNMTTNDPARAVLRKFDRAAIFVMIAGTYTPIGLVGIGGWIGASLVATVWVIGIFGIVATFIDLGKFENFSLAIYIAQGWILLLAIKPIYDNLNAVIFAFVVLGGLIYTSGVYFYQRPHLRFNRALWHGFVLAAATIHFAAIYGIADGHISVG